HASKKLTTVLNSFVLWFRHSGSFTPWNLMQLRNQSTNEFNTVVSFFVACVVQGDSCSEEMVGLEAQVLVFDAENSDEEQTGPDEKTQRRRNLSGDHHRAQSGLGSSRRSGTAFILQTRCHISAGSSERRRQAAEHSAEHRHREGKEQNVGV